jgi:hypothetical protein
MNEKQIQTEAGNTEQYCKMIEEIILQVIAKGGSISEAAEALLTIGLTREGALKPVYSLIDRGIIFIDNQFRLQLTGAGEAYVLENGVSSGVITELADTVVEHTTRMKAFGQRLLESVKDSY